MLSSQIQGLFAGERNTFDGIQSQEKVMESLISRRLFPGKREVFWKIKGLCFEGNRLHFLDVLRMKRSAYPIQMFDPFIGLDEDGVIFLGDRSLQPGCGPLEKVCNISDLADIFTGIN